MGRKKKAPDAGIIEFGRAIKRRREALNLYQKEVAEKVGISAPYLSQLESGDVKRPDNAILRSLARLLSIRLADYIAADGESVGHAVEEPQKYAHLGKPERRTRPALREVFRVVEEMLERQNIKMRDELRSAVAKLLRTNGDKAKKGR